MRCLFAHNSSKTASENGHPLLALWKRGKCARTLDGCDLTMQGAGLELAV